MVTSRKMKTKTVTGEDLPRVAAAQKVKAMLTDQRLPRVKVSLIVRDSERRKEGSGRKSDAERCRRKSERSDRRRERRRLRSSDWLLQRRSCKRRSDRRSDDIRKSRKRSDDGERKRKTKNNGSCRRRLTRRNARSERVCKH